MKGCAFCEAGSPLLPGYHQAGVFHIFDARVGGYPKCAHAFSSVKMKHPFIPAVSKAECDFCGKPKRDSIHKD